MGAAIVQIIFGFIGMLFGRNLFWLFVAIGGFLIGWFLAPAIFHSMVTWHRILVGVVLGILFAILARWFVKFMVAVAGFFLLGAATVVVIRDLGGSAPSGSAAYWLAYIIGGVIGAILLVAFFDWALIVFTSLAGAGSAARGIVHFATNNPRWLEVVLFVVFVVIGLLYQARSFLGGNRSLGRLR